MPLLRKPAICPYLDQNVSSFHHHNHFLKSILILSAHLPLPKSVFTPGFPIKLCMNFWIVPLRATCPALFSCLCIRFLSMLCEELYACSSVSYNFLHYPVISSLLVPHIFLNSLFSNTLNLCSYLRVSDKVSRPYRHGYNNMNFHVYSAFNSFANVLCIYYRYFQIFFYIFKR